MYLSIHSHFCKTIKVKGVHSYEQSFDISAQSSSNDSLNLIPRIESKFFSRLCRGRVPCQFQSSLNVWHFSSLQPDSFRKKGGIMVPIYTRDTLRVQLVSYLALSCPYFAQDSKERFQVFIVFPRFRKQCIIIALDNSLLLSVIIWQNSSNSFWNIN